MDNFEVNEVKLPINFNLDSRDKVEFDSLTQNKIDEIIVEFNNRKNDVLQKYLTNIIDLNIPDLHLVDLFIFDKEDISIPDVVEKDYDIYFKNYPKIDNNFELPDESIVSAKMNEVLDKINNLSAQIDNFIDVSQIKKIAKIKFRCFDQKTGSPIKINGIKINDEFILNIFYKISGYDYELNYEVTNPYKITFVKKGYQEKSMIIKPKFALSVDDVDILDLGNIYLFNESSEMIFTLTWGKIPEDLDLHVYSFDNNFNQLEHVWFENLYSPISNIYLDYDDTTSYGPENVHIFDLDKDKYYLFCVHNYSLFKTELESNAHMNYENKTNIRIKFYEKNLDIVPFSDGTYKDYWLDVFVIHDKKFIILNSFASSGRNKAQTFNFSDSKVELDYLKQKILSSTNIHQFDEFKN